MDVSSLNDKWKQMESDYLSALADKVTIYHRPTVSGTSNTWSTFTETSLDYETVLTVSGFGDQDYTTTEITGEIYLNVFGWQYSGDEELKRIPIGSTQPGDVLFIALAANVLIDSDDPSKGTQFDGCDFVVVEKDNNKYTPMGIYPNGIHDISSYYVLLRKTDKQAITYT